MGSLENCLGAVEEALLDRLMVEMMVKAEIQAMLAILEASEEIEQPLYGKVQRIIADAGYSRQAAMGLRGKVKRLEQAARSHMASFELEDGSRHYYDLLSGERFLHSMACLRAQGEGETTFPQPPKTLLAITRAKDRATALAQVYGRSAFDIFPYDAEALVERGVLVPRSMVVGRELGEPLEDLSE